MKIYNSNINIVDRTNNFVLYDVIKNVYNIYNINTKSATIGNLAINNFKLFDVNCLTVSTLLLNNIESPNSFYPLSYTYLDATSQTVKAQIEYVFDNIFISDSSTPSNYLSFKHEESFVTMDSNIASLSIENSCSSLINNEEINLFYDGQIGNISKNDFTINSMVAVDSLTYFDAPIIYNSSNTYTNWKNFIWGSGLPYENAHHYCQLTISLTEEQQKQSFKIILLSEPLSSKIPVKIWLPFAGTATYIAETNFNCLKDNKFLFISVSQKSIIIRTGNYGFVINDKETPPITVELYDFNVGVK